MGGDRLGFWQGPTQAIASYLGWVGEGSQAIANGRGSYTSCIGYMVTSLHRLHELHGYMGMEYANATQRHQKLNELNRLNKVNRQDGMLSARGDARPTLRAEGRNWSQ